MGIHFVPGKNRSPRVKLARGVGALTPRQRVDHERQLTTRFTALYGTPPVSATCPCQIIAQPVEPSAVF